MRPLVADFRVIPADLDEDSLTVPDPWSTAEGLALTKANWVAQQFPDHLVIGGDTVVAYQDESDWRQLSKPSDAADAIQMLQRLSGRTHVVITGLAVVYPGGEEVTHDDTRVTFREIQPDEIAKYVATGEPMDKAGGYAIQGGAKGFVSATNGHISAVVGLPVEKLSEILSRISAGL